MLKVKVNNSCPLSEAPRFHDSRHMKVVSLSVLDICRLYPPRNILGTHFCQRLSRTQGHRTTGRRISMNNSNDDIGKRIRDLPACSTVSEASAPPSAPVTDLAVDKISNEQRHTKYTPVPRIRDTRSVCWKRAFLWRWSTSNCVQGVQVM